MNRGQKDDLRKLVEGDIFFDEPMGRYTSFGIGGSADVLIFPREVSELIEIISYLRYEQVPCFVLGKGSNLLVKDGGIRGAVISLIRFFRRIKQAGENKDCAMIEAQAGISLTELIDYCLKRGVMGLEFASGIPGSLGGGLMMNAGSFGGELGQVVKRVTIINGEGKIREKERNELSFSYRKLHLSKDAIILSALLELKTGAANKMAHKVKNLLVERRLKQPLKYKSGGSVFKNPPGFFAGKIIDETGLKGLKMGDAMVSDHHANFIVNLGEAKAGDVILLMERVQREVYERKGIKLEPEIKVIGE